MEICIAVANWVKGPTIEVPSAPALDAIGAAGTQAAHAGAGAIAWG